MIDRGTAALLQLLGEVVGVDFRVVGPFVGHVKVREDRRDWANRLTCPAVNTLDWVDVQHVGGLMVRCVWSGVDAVDGTHVHTRSVFGPYARFSNYICHRRRKPPVGISPLERRLRRSRT